MEKPKRAMRTPGEVLHLLQSSVSEFPLEQVMDLRGQEMTDLSVQKVEVVHSTLTLDLWFAALRTD